MELRLINHEEVGKILSMKAAISVMEDAFAMLSEGGMTPPRNSMFMSQNQVLGAMPAYLKGIGRFGMKVNSVFAGNSGSQYHIHQGAVLVFEDKHGCLEAIVDAAQITNIRTAAASGLATKLLAPKDVSRLAVIGAGTQGSKHVEAMLAVRDIKSVTVWDLIPETSRAFAERESARHGVEITVAKTAEEAVSQADLICIATSSRQPVLLGEWVREGTHINSVGFSGPSGRELDNALIKQARIYTDCMATILGDCGDLLVPISEGVLAQSDIVGDLTGLLTGRIAARQAASDITLYKSAGVSVQDLACAHFIHQEALKLGIGTSAEFSGLNEL